jgi:hypothetical protein
VAAAEPLQLALEPQALPPEPHSMSGAQPELRQERQPELRNWPAHPQEPVPARNSHCSEQVQPPEPEQVLNSCIRSESGMLKMRNLLLKPGIYRAWGVSIEMLRLKKIYSHRVAHRNPRCPISGTIGPAPSDRWPARSLL